MKDLPIEVLETRYPMRMTEYRIRPDSGGAGRFRGGHGVIREFAFDCEEAYVSLWWERSRTPAWGLAGGADGAGPDVVVNPGRGTSATCSRPRGCGSGGAT